MRDRSRLHVLVAPLATVAILAAVPTAAGGATPVSTAPTAAPVAATGASVRTAVRVGAALFALGGIASYVAAGARRTTRRDAEVPER